MVKFKENEISFISQYLFNKSNSEIVEILNEKMHLHNDSLELNLFKETILEIQSLMKDCDDKYNAYFVERIIYKNYETKDLLETKEVLKDLAFNDFEKLNDDLDNELEMLRKNDTKILSKFEVENLIHRDLKENGIDSEYLYLAREIRSSYSEYFIISHYLNEFDREFSNSNDVYKEIFDENFEYVLNNKLFINQDKKTKEINSIEMMN